MAMANPAPPPPFPKSFVVRLALAFLEGTQLNLKCVSHWGLLQ